MKKSFLTLMMLTVTLSLIASCTQRPKSSESVVTEPEQTMTDNADAGLAPDFELPDLQGNPLKALLFVASMSLSTSGALGAFGVSVVSHT